MQQAPTAAQAIGCYFCSNKTLLFGRLVYSAVLAEHWLRNDRVAQPIAKPRTATEQRSNIMWAYTRQGKFRIARTRLSLEQLEDRQLMAADTIASTLASTFSSTTTRSPTSTSTLVVATRTIDGTGNNLLHAEWGSTGEELLRKAAAEYGDGISSLAGADRPSARTISNAIAAQDATTPLSDRDLSAFIYVWGQFLDHD